MFKVILSQKIKRKRKKNYRGTEKQWVNQTEVTQEVDGLNRAGIFWEGSRGFIQGKAKNR